MKKNPTSKSSSVPRVDPYIESLMAKLVERLIGLEKKVDKVIAQTAGRTSAPQFQPPARQERTLYEAICADCSKVCEVPFKPTDARPVYCKECWAKRKSGKVAAGSSRPGMPVLTPVALPPRPASKLFAGPQAALPARAASKKTKKSSPAKKTKKKK